MRKLVIPSAAAFLIALCQSAFAEPPKKQTRQQLPFLEQKLIGEWQGRIACDGRLILRADGGYDLKQFGPAPYDSAGKWKIQSDATGITLVLTCWTSEVDDEVGRAMKFKLDRISASELAIRHGLETGGRYRRAK